MVSRGNLPCDGAGSAPDGDISERDRLLFVFINIEKDNRNVSCTGTCVLSHDESHTSFVGNKFLIDGGNG